LTVGPKRLSLKRSSHCFKQLEEFCAFSFFPSRLTYDNSDVIPIPAGFSDPRAILFCVYALVFIWAVVVLTLYSQHSRRVFLWPLCASLVIIPSINILINGDKLLAEQQTYVPAIGVCLMLGRAFATGKAVCCGQRRYWERKIRVGLFLLLVAAFALKTQSTLPAWRNEDSLYLASSLEPTNSARSKYNSGIVFTKIGNYESAGRFFSESLALCPDNTRAIMSLGRIHLITGDVNAAELVLRQLLNVNCSSPIPHRTASCINELRTAMRYVSEFMEIYSTPEQAAQWDFITSRIVNPSTHFLSWTRFQPNEILTEAYVT